MDIHEETLQDEVEIPSAIPSADEVSPAVSFPVIEEPDFVDGISNSGLDFVNGVYEADNIEDQEEVESNTSDEVNNEGTETFNPAKYVEPPLEDNVVESVFAARFNKYKKGSIEWIREEHEIVSEHLGHVEEDFDKFSRILKLDIAIVRSAKVVLKERTAELTDLLDAQESLNNWIAERQNTYAWQLLDALNEQRNRIAEFETEVQAWCDKSTEELYKASLEHHKRFKRKLKWGFGGILLALSIGTIVNLILDALGLHWIFKILGVIAPLIGLSNPFACVPVIIAGLSVVTWISALATNFRSYLKFRKQLKEQVFEARFYLRAMKELSLQKNKIALLHGQVQDFLVFMAEILHKPWVVDEKWLSYETSSIDPEKLPASFVVAKPLESGVFNDVTKRAVEELCSSNWRTRQFETLVSEYETLYLMSPNSLEPRINTDPAIRQKLKTDMESSKILNIVGDSFVLQLAEHLQKNVLPKELGFYVGSIKPDPLSKIDLSRGIFSDGDQELNWHSFVTAILGQASGWSNLAYSVSGLEEKLYSSSSMRSFALIPDRLKQDVVTPVEAISVKKEDDSGVEVVIRVDVSNWLDPEKVALLKDRVALKEENIRAIPEIDRPDVAIRG